MLGQSLMRLEDLTTGMHQSVAALTAKANSTAPKFVAHSNPLPLSLRESVELDSFLLVLAALFILVPFCLLSGKSCRTS